MAVPWRRAACAAVAILALALLATACGGGDDGSDGGGATATGAATTGDDAGVITSSTGATCSARTPDPPADPTTYSAAPPMTIDTSATYRATMSTSCGDIVIALDAKGAPETVNNFVFLSREGFYDGLTFHRVVSGFVIQGGDPEGKGYGGPGYTFPDELPDDGYPTGSVAMANSGPDTNGSQFFIVTGDASALPNSFSKFGRVVKGLDVARTIETFVDPSADPGDPASQTPTSPIYIFSVRITPQA
jgi:cyclophilin family peptidyl-prolyl cis-trans isomerase